MLWNKPFEPGFRGWLRGFIQIFLALARVPVSTWQLSFGFLLTVSLWLPVHLCGLATPEDECLWFDEEVPTCMIFLTDWWYLLITLWGRILMPCLGSVGKSAVVDLWYLPQVEDWTVGGYVLSICILAMCFRYDRKIYDFLASLWFSPIAIVQCRDWGGLRIRYYTRALLSIK